MVENRKNDRVKLTIWLDKKLKKKLDLILKEENYQTYAEYIRSRIREDFEKLSLKGVSNGNGRI